VHPWLRVSPADYINYVNSLKKNALKLPLLEKGLRSVKKYESVQENVQNISKVWLHSVIKTEKV